MQLNATFARNMLPRRPPEAHKGSFGTLALLAGSRFYRGAATLAAGAALGVGTGIVRLVGIECVCAAVAATLPCCTFLPVDESEDGGMAPMALPAALQLAPSAILAGCGMGQSRATGRIALGLLKDAECPLLLDADALNCLAEQGARSPGAEAPVYEALFSREAETVLTPHMGEMARLCGMETSAVIENQEALARAFARENRCVVVLKSHRTVVAAPDGRTALHERPNPGLAKGGSGDVLAGLLGGLLAQGLPAMEAACTAVWLHGEAAAAASQAYGPAAMSPAHLAAFLPGVLKALGH